MSINVADFPTTLWDGLSINRSTRTQDAGPDYEDWDQIVAEVLAVQDYLVGEQASGAGTAGTSVDASTVRSSVNVSTLTLDAVSVNLVDSGANGGHGSHALLTFPAGNILILGAVCDLTYATAPAGDIDDDAALVTAVGSVATAVDNATLTSTEANIIPSMTSTLMADAGAGNGESTAPVTLNGTSSAAVARLNLAIPDADIAADEPVVVSGTVTITWINLGDN
jgi:hypothetical protein